MNFIVDAHLPKRLCQLLEESGHSVTHTSSLAEGNRTTDQTICELANQLNATVITKDSDFYFSHILNHSPEKLILVKTGNIGIQELLDLFKLHFDTIIESLTEHDLLELDRSTVSIPHPE